METKARECIGYEVTPKNALGRRFIISEMDWSEYAMRLIGAVEKIYFIEKSAYEQLQKRVEELEAENKKLREALSKESLIDVIEQWLGIWMNQKINADDTERYRRRAMGVDANMRGSLVRIIRERVLGEGEK